MGPKFKVGDIIHTDKSIHEYIVVGLDISSMEYNLKITAVIDFSGILNGGKIFWRKPTDKEENELEKFAFEAVDKFFSKVDPQFPSEVLGEWKDTNTCTCTSRDLFNFGCKCGGI